MTDALTRMELVLHLRRRGITDVRVLNAFERVPREMFVPSDFADDAYGDSALPIACGQTISQPFVVAYMTEKLGPDPNKAVLEIGTGSGYQTAILAHVFREVFTLEYHEPLLARRRSAPEGARAHEHHGHGRQRLAGLARWRENASVSSSRPPRLKCQRRCFAQLADGGRMIIPLESEDGQFLTEVVNESGHPQNRRLLPVQFVPLLDSDPPAI